MALDDEKFLERILVDDQVLVGLDESSQRYSLGDVALPGSLPKFWNLCVNQDDGGWKIAWVFR